MIAGSPWSDQAVSRLRGLISEGYSYSQAAKALTAEFGRTITRNAVSAKIDRLDLNGGKPVTLPTTLRAPEVKRDLYASAGANFGKVNVALRADRTEAPRRTSPPDSIALDPKPIHDCGFSHSRCKWPLVGRNEAGDIMICQNASDRRTYCAEHQPYSADKTLPKDAKAAQAAITAAHRKANAGKQGNGLVFSPRGA